MEVAVQAGADRIGQNKEEDLHAMRFLASRMPKGDEEIVDNKACSVRRSTEE